MAKKLTVNIEEKRINAYLKGVDSIYRIAILEVSNLVSSLNYDSSKPFTWNSYPQTKAKIDKVIHGLFSGLNVTITDATTKEWLEACMANDKLVKKFLNNTKFKAITTNHYYQRNLEALESFQKRKANGLNLSQRIWNMSQQFKNELEMCIDVGLSEGRSASELSRDIRQYLNEPNKLYRRVQNSQNGKFYLSKNAKKYNPGTGMYRSSYKNAMRVTRTETNMAYRASDLERWNQLDFVIGYEVRRSNNVFCCKVCEALVGVYPKWFKFQGWHPQCRCYAVPVLAKVEDFIAAQKRLLSGDDSHVNYKQIESLPPSFIHWAQSNSNRIASASKKPYFLKDNFSNKDLSKGLKYLK